MRGAFRIGRLLGIDVFLHWSWAVVAVVEIQTRTNKYSSQAWNIVEYLALFLIVLMHEFGHALACRSVGGRAERILLWPLGGVAYVQAPPRPGALLWSIAAGPLVNLVLVALLTPVVFVTGLLPLGPDPRQFVVALWAINAGLFVFNMLPVYPLDGGQIVQSLLWYVVGRARSLLVVSVIGMVGAVALGFAAVAQRSWWFGALAAFIWLRARGGMKQAQALASIAAAPRREGFSCPSCHSPPPAGAFWLCACKERFDTFERQGICPRCCRTFAETLCTECSRWSPHREFYPPGMRGQGGQREQAVQGMTIAQGSGE
jgi:Zn-dependent protease